MFATQEKVPPIRSLVIIILNKKHGGGSGVI